MLCMLLNVFFTNFSTVAYILFICNLFNVDKYTKLATDMYKINV